MYVFVLQQKLLEKYLWRRRRQTSLLNHAVPRKHTGVMRKDKANIFVRWRFVPDCDLSVIFRCRSHSLTIFKRHPKRCINFRKILCTNIHSIVQKKLNWCPGTEDVTISNRLNRIHVDRTSVLYTGVVIILGFRNPSIIR